MKTKEITVSLSGVIPVAAYENLRPGYSITVEPEDGEFKEAIIAQLNTYLRSVFDHASNAAKADLIAKQYAGIRLYEKDGIKYPSVTSILFYGKEWRVTEDELSQYGARGTIVGEMVENYLCLGKYDGWLDPEATEELKDDVATLLGGSLNMHWNQCSHKAFIKKFGDKIKTAKVQGIVYNDECRYAGTYDILGEYDGKKAIMDVKCGGFDMRQLAAYAMCCEGIERLVVLPTGPTDNKCGYKKPVICDTIQKEFESFLKARARFRQRFGI